jgi:folate-dependent phosphoribosylglycinamide formyltransferase PurN
MLTGVPEVGVTVHQVNDALDGGPIVSQQTFPLELAPAEDPLRYLMRLQWEVLAPNGIRMMTEAVRLAARGQMVAVPQPALGSRAQPAATWTLKRRLRRVVAARRR